MNQDLYLDNRATNTCMGKELKLGRRDGTTRTKSDWSNEDGQEDLRLQTKSRGSE